MLHEGKLVVALLQVTEHLTDAVAERSPFSSFTFIDVRFSFIGVYRVKEKQMRLNETFELMKLYYCVMTLLPLAYSIKALCLNFYRRAAKEDMNREDAG